MGVQDGVQRDGSFVRLLAYVGDVKIQDLTVRSSTCLSNGLKSRPGNCPYTPVAQGSGV